MPGVATKAPIGDEARPSPRPTPSELAQVRALLFGVEHKQLLALKSLLDDPAQHARVISDVVAEAIALRTDRDDSVAKALEPSIDNAIHASVRKNPQPLIDALFPIIGPVIRKSIAETFNQMLQTLNSALEHRFSLRSLKWRMEARKTGKSYAEVALLHALVYRVEQVFLIHRESGLLLANILSEKAFNKDPDTVSAMLTAIQDFVSDSFAQEERADLQSTRVGELTVILEKSPFALLAAVARGAPPANINITLRETLEKIHIQKLDDLRRYNGDASVFEDIKPDLQTCLLSKEKEDDEISGRRLWRVWIIALILLIPLASATFSMHQERQRWHGVLNQLEQEPGLVIVDAQKQGDAYLVRGLRDDLARDPDTVLQQTPRPQRQIVWRWQPYISMQPQLVIKRIQDALDAPKTVTMAFNDGALTVRGQAHRRWIQQLKTRAALFTGVRDVITADLKDIDATEFLATKASLETLSFYFDTNATRLNDDQYAQITIAGSLIDKLAKRAEVLDVAASIMVIGRADHRGREKTNIALSKARAAHVEQLLIDRGVQPTLLTTRATTPPTSATRRAEDEQRLRASRRVDFEVIVAEVER